MCKTGKVNLLLQHGALVNAPACGNYGSALQAAAVDENEVILQLLLDHGAEVNARGGNTKLLFKLLLALMQRLLDAGADVNLKSPSQYGTALQVAVDQGAKEVVMEPLARRTDVNIKAGYWGTALTRAAYKGDEELFHILLDGGVMLRLRLQGMHQHADRQMKGTDWGKETEGKDVDGSRALTDTVQLWM